MLQNIHEFLGRLAPPERLKEFVVVIDVDKQTEKGPIVYDYAEKEIWLVHNLDVVKGYLLSVLKAAERCTVVVWYDDAVLFFRTMEFLYNFDNLKQTWNTVQYATHAYNYYLSKISGKTMNNTQLPPFCCDMPIGFELLVAIAPSKLHRHHLSSTSIGLIQILRTVTYIHGGQFAILQGEGSKSYNTSGILQLLEKVGCDGFVSDQRPDAKPVYMPSDKVSLLIPKLWDTLDNIQLLSASKVDNGLDSEGYMIQNDEDHHNFLQQYKSSISDPSGPSLRQLLATIDAVEPEAKPTKVIYLVRESYEQLVSDIESGTTNTI